MITKQAIEDRLDHHARLELAGVEKPPLYYGPPVLLWTKSRDKTERWELLPEYVAELVVSDFHNDPSVARARLYRRLPEEAPTWVALAWFRVRLGEKWPVLFHASVSTPLALAA